MNIMRKIKANLMRNTTKLNADKEELYFIVFDY